MVIRRIRDSCYYWSSSPSRKEKFEDMAKSMKVPCSRSLALDVKTRWNSTYFMLQSALPYREVFTRLKRGERGYDCLPTGEDWFLAHELLGKLKLFNTVTELFSGTKNITANSYFPKVCQIKVALTSWLDSPIEIVRVMASKMLEKYDKYWNECHDIMCIVCVLDPRLKLKLVVHYYQKIYGDLADSYVERVKQNCRNLLHEYQEIQGNSLSGVGTSQPNLGWDLNEDDPLAEFDMLVESDYASAVINSSELDFYLEEKLSPRTPDFDVLAWWKVNGGKFPTLQRMARDILAIPVSTVASESIFSICGKVISQHRSRLHSMTVEALMCAQSWLWNEITDSTGCEGISFPPRATDQEDDVEATTSP